MGFRRVEEQEETIKMVTVRVAIDGAEIIFRAHLAWALNKFDTNDTDKWRNAGSAETLRVFIQQIRKRARHQWRRAPPRRGTLRVIRLA